MSQATYDAARAAAKTMAPAGRGRVSPETVARLDGRMRRLAIAATGRGDITCRRGEGFAAHMNGRELIYDPALALRMDDLGLLGVLSHEVFHVTKTNPAPYLGRTSEIAWFPPKSDRVRQELAFKLLNALEDDRINTIARSEKPGLGPCLASLYRDALQDPQEISESLPLAWQLIMGIVWQNEVGVTIGSEVVRDELERLLPELERSRQEGSAIAMAKAAKPIWQAVVRLDEIDKKNDAEPSDADGAPDGAGGGGSSPGTDQEGPSSEISDGSCDPGAGGPGPAGDADPRSQIDEGQGPNGQASAAAGSPASSEDMKDSPSRSSSTGEGGDGSAVVDEASDAPPSGGEPGGDDGPSSDDPSNGGEGDEPTGGEEEDGQAGASDPTSGSSPTLSRGDATARVCGADDIRDALRRLLEGAAEEILKDDPGSRAAASTIERAAQDERLRREIADVADQMAEEIERAAAAQELRGVRPSAEGYEAARQAVSSHIGPLGQRLGQVLLENARRAWSGGHEEGVLSGDLWRARTGASDLFSKRDDAGGHRWRIVLVRDESLSMADASLGRRTPMECAREALVLFVEAITMADHAARGHGGAIECAVLGFDNQVRLYKGFDEPMDHVRRALIGTPDAAAGGTSDDRALERALALLDEADGAEGGFRRLVIVLSDGIGQKDAIRARALAAAKAAHPTHVIGVGICHEGVRDCYPEHLVIHEPTELSRALAQILRRTVRKRG